MNKPFPKLLILFIVLVMHKAWAAGDPPAKARKVVAASEVLEQDALHALQEQLKGVAIQRTGTFSSSSAFVADNVISAEVQNTRDSASALFKRLDRQNKFIDMDSQQEPPLAPVQFPLGLKKHFGSNNIVYVGFSRAVIKPTHAELTAFVKMEMYVEDGQTGTKKKRELFFGAEGIKMTNNGKIVGDARLVLLGDYTLPMFNGKMKLILKGGEISEATGGILNADRTFAILDCNGFREAGITADAIFDPSFIKPLDINTGLKKQGNVEASLSIIGGLTNFNDILAKLNFKSGFYLEGHEKWGFAVKDMFFDASIEHNHSGIGYLSDYYIKHPDIAVGDVQEWRGIGLNSFKLFLPEEFKKKNGSAGVSSSGRVSIEVNRLIIDKYGVSCDAGVGNISSYSLADGKTSDTKAWKMSLDNFYLTFDQSKLSGGKFGGKILLPVSNDNLSAYVYSAVIDLKGEYSLSLSPRDQINFDIFKAKATLTQSTVTLAVVPDPLNPGKKKFSPTAELSGFFTVEQDTVKNSTNNSKAKLESKQHVVFQGLFLGTEAPYISLQSAGYSRQSSIANFPVTVDNFNVSIGRVGNNVIAKLGGGMNMNLMGGGAETDSTSATGFGVKSIFKISAKLDNNPAIEYHRWQFEDISIKPAGLDAKIGKYWFAGSLVPYDTETDRGLTATLVFKRKHKGDWNTVGSFTGFFGNEKETDFRYWLVEGFADVKFMSLGAVDLKGIGGSVYHHLYPTNAGTTMVTSNAIPGPPIKYAKSNNKLGFKAVVGMVSAGKEFMKGMVGLEIIFNEHWGVSSIGLFGNATLAADFKPGFKTPAFADTIQSKFKEVSTRAVDNKVGEVLSKSKLIAKGTDEFNNNRTPSEENTGQIALSLALKLDFENDNLHGDGAVYVNSSVMNGVYAGGLAGKFVLHFDKDEWYIHAGRPDERIGLRLGAGSFGIKATTYIMVGHRIPPMPPPPPQILALLGNNYAAAVPSRDETAIASGVGIAFGAEVSMNTGQMRAAIFYAQFEAGAGLDVMLSKGNHTCEGINGWYARGQAYAYVGGDVGITVKVGFVRKNISIFKGSAGVLLQAGLPNPAWFKGNVAGRYSALGGLVKGNFNLKLAIGNECGSTTGSSNGRMSNYISATDQNARQGNDSFLQLEAYEPTPLIVSYTPEQWESTTETDSTAKNPLTGQYVLKTDTYTTSNSVFTIPTITFAYPVNKEFKIANATGGFDTYKLVLSSSSFKKGTTNVAHTLIWDDSKTVLTLNPNAVLAAEGTYSFSANVQLYKNNVAQTGGRGVQDNLSISFKTGKTEQRIPAANIAFMYPVDGQRFMYKSERNNGYIKLKRSQASLGSITSSNRKVIFESESDTFVTSWSIIGDSISFAIPNLSNSKKYDFYLKGNDSLIVYQGQFRTSQYNSVWDKWNSLSNPVSKVYKSADQASLKNAPIITARANMLEWFDEVELKGNNLTGFKPLVYARNALTESYYVGNIAPLMYSGTFASMNVLSTTEDLKNEVLLSSKYLHFSANYNHSDSLKKWVPFEYNLSSRILNDYEKVRNKVAANYVQNNGFGSSSTDYKNKAELLLTQAVPYLQNGQYQIDIYKKTPNSTSNSNKIFLYQVNNLIDDRGYSEIVDPGAMVVNKTFFDNVIESICANPLDRIITTSKIFIGAKVKMTAVLEIILDEGFETMDDADFEAEIGTCTN